MNGERRSESTRHRNQQPVGNYRRKFFRLVREGKIPYEPGVVSHVVFRHDGWCPALSGLTCTCDPDVEYFSEKFPYCH
jgi:hypothetical protein